MNTSCESTSTLELREQSLAVSAAIGRCWQQKLANKKVRYWILRLARTRLSFAGLNLGLCETLALGMQRSGARCSQT